MATSLNFARQTATTGPPTRQSANSLQHVQTDFLGASVRTTTGRSRWARFRTWCHQQRHQLTAAAGVAAAVGVVFPPVLAVGALFGMGRLLSQQGPILERPCAQMEAYAASVLGVADVTTVSGVLVDKILDDGDRLLTRSVRQWVRKAKLHFGEVKDTRADQLCVKKWLAEQMKEADMRDKEARGLIPVVAFLSTVPDSDDAVANFMRHSGVVSIMRILGGESVGA